MPERRAGVRSVAADIDGLGRHRRRALRARLGSVLHALSADPYLDPDGGNPDPWTGSTRSLVEAVLAACDPRSADTLWLLISTVSGTIPGPERMSALHRTATLDGVLPALRAALPHLPPALPPHPGRWPVVRIVTDRVLVDVSDTAATELVTGIQRVTRETTRRWARDHPVLLVGWNARENALVPLVPAAVQRMLVGMAPYPAPDVGADVVVPWRTTYLLPELATEHRRTASIRSLVTFSGGHSAMIGFDCVPITTGETVGDGMGGGFALMLAAAAQMDRVATISTAAGVEYNGWRAMLAGAGLAGPAITTVSLATEGVRATPAMQRKARVALGRSADLPIVLAVGSHEPRKNHLAVLHAAELLWREGMQFALVFVGGHAWRSDTFTAVVTDLQAAGRPVQTWSGVSDDFLWGLYRIATVMVFPSLNEGFGLPITEALANGTPVVTSDFGSMAEIARDGGGCILVDPRDDHAIESGLRTVLGDPELRASLSAEAAGRPVVSWDDYAARTWAALTPAAAPKAAVAPAGGPVGRVGR